MTTTVVWTEIPVNDLAKAEAFYTAVFQWEMKRDLTGPNPMTNFTDDMSSTGGHLYPGKPGAGTGPTIHLAVPDKLETAMDRCSAAGGTVTGPVITIPPGRFVYATDPDGNSIGLFEPNKG